MNKLRYFLYEETLIQTFEDYNKEVILKAICDYLSTNKDAEITLEKEVPKIRQKRFVGNDILGWYRNNPKSGKPSRVVSIGHKEYHKELTQLETCIAS